VLFSRAIFARHGIRKHPSHGRLAVIALNVCISGFTQSHGRTHGIYRLSEKLLAEGHNNGTHRRVWYCRWN
jgi:hypothetical protein